MPFKNPNEEYESTMAAVSGVAQAAQPALWQPWEAARNDILREAQPLAALRARYPDQSAKIDAAIARSGVAAAQLKSLPILDRAQAGA